MYNATYGICGEETCSCAGADVVPPFEDINRVKVVTIHHGSTCEATQDLCKDVPWCEKSKLSVVNANRSCLLTRNLTPREPAPGSHCERDLDISNVSPFHVINEDKNLQLG